MNFNTFDEVRQRVREIEKVNIENARLHFHNFDGKSQFNNNGDIEYGVIIDDPEFAKKLAEEGWDIRIKEYPDRDPRYYIKAKINFEPRRKDGTIIEEYVPSIFVFPEGSDSMTRITSKEEMAMYETNPESNTRVDIVSVDCVLRPKPADRPTPHITAYTDHMVIKVRMLEKTSNSDIRLPKYAGVKGYLD